MILMNATPLPDTLCPECHGPYELRLVKRDALVKRCVECAHEWHEERPSSEAREPFVRRAGYVWRFEVDAR